MDFRRIDKNTVQCILSEEEMNAYGFRIEDFFSNQEKAREFLEHLVERAEEEIGYEAHSGMVSMQIMKMPDNGIVITLSERDNSADGFQNMLQHIHQQLYQKVNGNQKCDLRQGDLIGFLKCDKQQRHKVVYHCLHNIADKTGVHRLLIRASHVSDSPPFAAVLPALPLPFWHRRSGWGADDRRCHSLLQKQ